MISRKAVVSDSQNPIQVEFSSELRDVRQMSLVYFRMTGVDVSALPQALFISVSGIQGLEHNQSVISGIRIPSSCVPLYFQLERTYNNGVDPNTQYPVLHGLQPPEMTWNIESPNVINLTRASISIYDETGNLFPFLPQTRIYLTFKVAYDVGGIPKLNWANQFYINHLDG